MKCKFRIKRKGRCGGSTEDFGEFTGHGVFYPTMILVRGSFIETVIRLPLHKVNFENITTYTTLTTLQVFERLRTGLLSSRRVDEQRSGRLRTDENTDVVKQPIRKNPIQSTGSSALNLSRTRPQRILKKYLPAQSSVSTRIKRYRQTKFCKRNFEPLYSV